MRTVIGLDPSFTRTGVAVWQEGRVATFSVATTRRDGPRVARESLIVRAVWPWVSYIDPQRILDDGPAQTVVVIEAVHLSRTHRGRTALDLAGLHDVLVYRFYARGLAVGVAHPQCAKILATGKGNAAKADMVAATRSEWGIQVANDDEADAAWMMAAGVVTYGGRINGWPSTWDKARAASLAKIEWVGSKPDPQWLGGGTDVG